MLILISSTTFASPPIPEETTRRLKNTSTLRQEAIPKALAHVLIKQLIDQGLPYPDGYNQKKPSDCFTAYRIDLNNDGKSEWLIKCGGDQKCLFCSSHNGTVWAYSQDGKESLLKGTAGYMVGLSPLVTSTNNYLDLVTREHSSAREGEWTLYQFHGEKYMPVSCFTETIEKDHKGFYISKYDTHSCIRQTFTK